MPFLAIEALAHMAIPPLQVTVGPYSNAPVWLALERLSVFTFLVHSAVARRVLQTSVPFRIAAEKKCRCAGMVPFGRLRPGAKMSSVLASIPVVPVAWPKKHLVGLGAHLLRRNSNSDDKKDVDNKAAASGSGSGSSPLAINLSVLMVHRGDTARPAFVKAHIDNDDADEMGVVSVAIINGVRIRPGFYPTFDNEEAIDAIGVFLCSFTAAMNHPDIVKPATMSTPPPSYAVLLLGSQSKARVKEGAKTKIDHGLLKKVSSAVALLAKDLADSLRCPVLPVIEAFSTRPMKDYKKEFYKAQFRENWVVVHRDNLGELVSPVARAQLGPLRAQEERNAAAFHPVDEDAEEE